MRSVQNIRINTAGAYVCIHGFYVFAIGTKLHNGCIPVVRLGGHREGNETGWQCAVREVCEEANLHIRPLLPQTTYLSDWSQIESGPQEFAWEPEIEQEPIPILVISYLREEKAHLSLMYLAQADELPRPSSEVKGLLLLEEKDVHSLCQESLTLEQYLSRGGKAILNAEFDKQLVLEPFVQLRLFSRILSRQSQSNAIEKLE